MNKLSVLIFSLSVVVFSAFTTASAQDLKAAWLEYQNSRNILSESYSQIDAAWVIAADQWANGPAASRQGVLDSWVIINNAWVEIDAARAIVASTLKITLTDSSARGSTPPSTDNLRAFRSSGPLPWTPEPTWGSQQELDQAWASMNQAFASADSAWRELGTAWRGISAGNDAVVQQWASTDAEWAKINAAWAELDATWASKR